MTDKPAIVHNIGDVRIWSQELKTLMDTMKKNDRTRLQTAYEMGRLLIKVYATLDHGEKGKFHDRIGMDHRRASEYVRVAENWGKVPESGTLEEYLTACNGIRLCSDPKPPITIISTDADASDDAESWADKDAEPAEPARKRKPAPSSASTAPSSAAKPQPATPPAPTYPARVAPHFASAPLFKDIAQKAVRLENLVREAEESVAFKTVHHGQHVVYSSTLKLMASNFENDTPIEPCTEGCAENEPSMDSDPCPKCGGKGYLTQEDIDNAA